MGAIQKWDYIWYPCGMRKKQINHEYDNEGFMGKTLNLNQEKEKESNCDM